MRLSTWDQVISTEETNSFVRELACEHLRQVWVEMRPNSYTARVKREIHNALWYEDFKTLVTYELDYDQLTSTDAYHLRQALAFFSKRSDLDLGINREEVAYVKFCETEDRCRETNSIFKAWSQGDFNFPPDVEAIIYRAQRKISDVLGDVPSFSTLRLRFGPGATTQIQKRNASARRKLSQTYACSEDLSPNVARLLEEMPAWIPFQEDSDTATVSVDIVPGKLAFVPKNAKTDRSIVVEPMLNSMLQLGIGDYIADRLRRFGIDISDQTRNQNLARLGSLHGELATLDLSSASDLIAYELVAHLLPLDWFFLLRTARTGCVTYKDQSLKLHKFSSMGNGFTFPLETLIFWALASSCCEKSAIVSVYGDDIIIPANKYNIVQKVLHAVGFEVNSSKSFASGPFRESCGKDYHTGIDIRPVYLKDKLSCSAAFVLHNYYYRRLEHDMCQLIRGYLDPSVILEGPDGYGDGHLITDRRGLLSVKASHLANGWRGFTFETFSWRGRKDFRPLPGDYVYPSYSVYTRSGDNPEPSRGTDLIFRDAALARRIFGSSFRDVLESLVREAPLPHETRKDGSFGVSLPGVKGYRRIKIYTLG